MKGGMQHKKSVIVVGVILAFLASTPTTTYGAVKGLDLSSKTWNN